MKITTNFSLQELVNPEIYNTVGDRALDFLNPLLPMTLQALRDEFGLIKINDWEWGGNFVDSGLRLPVWPDGYAKLSAHRFGSAADCKFLDGNAEQIQFYIKANQDEFPYITRMENAVITKTWLHIEVGKRNDDIIIFNP